MAKVRSKQEWPDWYPTGDILVRHPELRTGIKQLPSGEAIPAAPTAHGRPRAHSVKAIRTRLPDPWHKRAMKIGSNLSSGCIRMLNDDVIDLYQRTPVGTKVVVLL